VGRLAELASGAKATDVHRSWFCYCRGLAEYRAGRFAAAEQWCRAALAAAPPAECRAAAVCVLAMARFRQGREEAGKLLADAVAMSPPADDPRLKPGAWPDQLALLLLRREAEALLAAGPTPPPREVK
jgi:hypothetical protein